MHWSENESVAKQLQTEMTVLVDKLNKIGTSGHNLDTESAIHLAIEETQVRKILSICSKKKVYFYEKQCSIDQC